MEIEKKLFVEENEEQNIEEVVDEFVKLGNITPAGKTLLKPELNEKLGKKERLGIQIIGKAVASMVRNEINPQVTLGELNEWNKMIIPDNQIMARTAELVKDGTISRIGKGVFQARPYYLKHFIQKLTKRHNL